MIYLFSSDICDVLDAGHPLKVNLVVEHSISLQPTVATLSEHTYDSVRDRLEFKGMGVANNQEHLVTLVHAGGPMFESVEGTEVWHMAEDQEKVISQLVLKARINREVNQILKPLTHMHEYYRNLPEDDLNGTTYQLRVFVLRDLSCLDKTRENTVVVTYSHYPVNGEHKLRGHVITKAIGDDTRLVYESFEAWRFKEVDVDSIPQFAAFAEAKK